MVDFFNLSKLDKDLGDKTWSPLVATKCNDHVLRIAAIEGEYHWHSHEKDELFLVVDGEITIDSDEGSFSLKKGEGITIPKGLRHCPKAKKRAVILLFVPEEVDPRGVS